MRRLDPTPPPEIGQASGGPLERRLVCDDITTDTGGNSVIGAAVRTVPELHMRTVTLLTRCAK
jgi:hypothetical protein